MKKASKKKKIIWWIFGSLFLLIFGTIFVFLNFRTYGLYYAEQYYGKDHYYQLLREDFKNNSNIREKTEYKNVFALYPEKPNKMITFGNAGGRAKMSIETNTDPTIPSVTGPRLVYIQHSKNLEMNYLLDDDNKLKFDFYNENDNAIKPHNFKSIYKEDTKIFKKYVTQYFDIQLELIGKPIINLQWLYNIVQMK
ncbi:hypothetical protein JOC36_000957 [Weissella uvarum]|uniref:hypothetical protein n=1 Tax=Weissella uvarum TaxID=1479233 RepID=UPI00195F9F0A|nr:hypothetical protein [Weissella uvarum]MBM7617400.1 hypothetical protein [Weissella uvarum]MCM0595716.1 hypothetical protein [Weissella uvarum]